MGKKSGGGAGKRKAGDRVVRAFLKADEGER
jgi:hypothetical protein